ncbi:hypothetical protein GCK72_022740 [Caenorhabditis remanei]|uniref:Uncharacterized protein n=1 Tax=Caenorhabditis remanei TaxID=31234 RepID=A0A6A5FUL4_CAERE|nr:hypothetical protein GCK72_022740 [Caenorhabditis remanei]KAF1746287.1 hypothetical protein GCK72_022740 [Caenorhabditis remanei]
MRWLGLLWKAPGGILQKRLDHNFDRPAAATSTNTRQSDLVRVMATLSLSGLSMKSGSAVAVPSGVLFPKSWGVVEFSCYVSGLGFVVGEDVHRRLFFSCQHS